MKKVFYKAEIFLSGLANSLFGSGGGILAVSFFSKKGLNQKSSQATALLSMLFLSAISMIYYLYKRYFSFSDAIIYVPFGIIGAVTGSFILPKIPDKLLKKIFALFIIYAGIKTLRR